MSRIILVSLMLRFTTTSVSIKNWFTSATCVVPNSVVFASAIEKASSGNLDRQRFRISGIERPLLEIEPAIKEALKGATHLSRRGPLVHILSAGPEGAAATVAVEYDLGHRIDATIISKLRAAFPEAVVTAGAAGDEA